MEVQEKNHHELNRLPKKCDYFIQKWWATLKEKTINKSGWRVFFSVWSFLVMCLCFVLQCVLQHEWREHNWKIAMNYEGIIKSTKLRCKKNTIAKTQMRGMWKRLLEKMTNTKIIGVTIKREMYNILPLVTISPLESPLSS